MKTNLNDELKSLFHHFEDWDDIMRDYYELTYGKDNDDADDLDKNIKNTLELHNIFETLLMYFTRYGKFKDSWGFPARMNDFPFRQHATVGSGKLGVDFDFGLDYGNLFLSTYIRYPSFIKNMDNTFWSLFTELDSLGQFNFVENSFPSSNDAEIAMKKFKNSNSSIFKLIRNHIFFEHYDGGSVDYGWLEIKWPISTSWDIIVKNGSSAFKNLYRINYMLYRAGYLRYGYNVKNYN